MENREICKKCKGRCCKNSSGIFTKLPVDWKERLGKNLTVAVLVSSFEGREYLRDYIQLKYSEGLYVVLMVKPMGVLDTGKVNPLFRKEPNKCTFLHKDGCLLTEGNRPFECSVMIPRDDFQCKGTLAYDLIEQILDIQEDLYYSCKEEIDEYLDTLEEET